MRMYLRLLGGLSFDRPSDEWIEGGHFGRAAGYHAGAMYGIYLGSSHVGFVLELGALHHRLSARIDGGECAMACADITDGTERACVAY